MDNAAVGFFIQEVAIFAGQTLVTMAPEAGLTAGRTLSAPLLVSMVVAWGAAGDTDPAWWNDKKEGCITGNPVLGILLEKLGKVGALAWECVLNQDADNKPRGLSTAG